ncbi:hypothetical protein IQ252_12235 [Tychonema sp. LEGE 07203]|nr:hypothetical protein [Tychonema sp. LEGE 07203]
MNSVLAARNAKIIKMPFARSPDSRISNNSKPSISQAQLLITQQNIIKF